MSRARLFGGTLPTVCTGAGWTISTTRLSAAHGLASYNVLASFSGAFVNSDPCYEQICLYGQSCCLLEMRLLERSFQRFADARHDSLVQVNSRPVRCLCRITHLSNPDAQTSIARGELCPFPGRLRDSTSKEHRKRLPEPSFQASLQRGHHRRWDQPGIIIQGMRDSTAYRKADMVMLVTRIKAPNVLQCRESFLHLSKVCVGASAGWPSPTCMQCCVFAADPRRLTPCRLRGTSILI